MSIVLTTPAAASKPQPAGLDQDWWYVRAYPGRADLMDAAAVALAPWLRERAAEAGATSYFFMRYLDQRGQHLRLRMRTGADMADHLHRRAPEVVDLLRGLAPTPGPHRLVERAGVGPQSGPVAVRAGVYAPELSKYAGAAGVARAEQVFTASTRWLAESEILSRALMQRAELAVTYVHEAVHAAIPADQHEQVWRRHHAKWLWQARMAVSAQTRTDLVTALVERAGRPSALRPPPTQVGAVATAVRAIDEPEHRIGLFIELMHMELNRLGLLPAEEWLIGQAAAGLRP